MHNLDTEQLEKLLESLPRVKPSLIFRARMRTRLFFRALSLDLDGHLLVKSVSFASATVFALLITIVSWVVYDNPSVYAGTPLYGLKRTIETIEMSLTARTPEAEAEGYLRLADRRREELQEIRSLVGNGYVTHSALKETLDEVVGSTDKALQAAKHSVDPAVTARVVKAAQAQAAQLQTIKETLPPEEDTDEPSSGSGSDADISEVPNGGTLPEPTPVRPSWVPPQAVPVITSGSGAISDSTETISDSSPEHANQLIENAANALQEIADVPANQQ